MNEKIKIGVSSCLLGNEVRYNGGHSHDRYVTGTLGQYFTFVAVCPEVEAGFGIPREAMRLVGDPEAPRLMTTKTKKDCTAKMMSWVKPRVKELEKEGLCGFIFKKGSPSSGMERVRVYTDKGMPSNRGSGMFARAFMNHFPLIPTEEDGRLNDSALRENFIERIFALRRWRLMTAERKNPGNIVAFHTAHKLQVMSHSIKHYRDIGRLVAQGKKLDIQSLYEQYETLFMQALSLKATVKKNVNVLQHMAGYFKKQLSKDEKQELQQVIEQYQQLYTPLIVPVTLMNHYVRKYDQEYLKKQHYLNPHPIELKLRNRA
ncbi:YbgA family protein [Thermodesulfobacteriota bacterium]